MEASVDTLSGLEKVSSGIPGFDGITRGGLPRSRPTLVCGDAGAGKTMFGMQFLVRGATEKSEPGIFVAFEESKPDLKKNVTSLGWNLSDLETQKILALEAFETTPDDMIEAGSYDLEGLFVRLDAAIRQVGARRMVLDTVEALFGVFQDAHVVRTEFRRLLAWLKQRDITAVVTAERGESSLTRFGIEEYVSDCVVDLSQALQGQTCRRHLRVLKYRGSGHETGTFPFLIGHQGIQLFPVTGVDLDYPVSRERVASGISRLDEMLGGQGFYRASSVLLSGTAGTGKSSMCASLVDAACRRGEQALYISYEESPAQIVRNMQSIGIDLQRWQDSNMLTFHTRRMSQHSLEEHFLLIKELVDDKLPHVVILDPVSNMLQLGSPEEVKNLLTRLIDLLKSQGITAFITELITGGSPEEATSTGISSLMDAWLLLRDLQSGGERNRVLDILKSRGMPHSHQTREFILTDRGISLRDVYNGPEGLVTGTLRHTIEAREEQERRRRMEEIEYQKKELEKTRKAKEAKIQEIEAWFQSKEERIIRSIRETEQEEEGLLKIHAQQRLIQSGN